MVVGRGGSRKTDSATTPGAVKLRESLQQNWRIYSVLRAGLGFRLRAPTELAA